MFKPLLLSGWFRVQPFIKYAVIAILIAPLVAASGHSTSAKQSEVANITSENGNSGSTGIEIAAVREHDLLADILTADPNNTPTRESDSQMEGMATVGESQLSPADNIDSLAGTESILKEDHTVSSSNVPESDPLAVVEIAPSTKVSSSQSGLLQKLKGSKIKSLKAANNFQPKEIIVTQSLAATQVTPILRESQPNTNSDIPVAEQPGPEQVAADPIGSPHPIPWKWILATQEAIGSKGGGVRYYRSVPVASPDGKYVVYSRVRLEVKPEMHNSRVTSVLFVEEVQTKKLRVIASTSVLGDPLLQTKAQTQEATESNGKIGVLVPVSWSEKGDRFLARRFEGIFNTADATDRAVIWDRQNNQANTVSPVSEADEHEKIAVLLGWSKGQPDHVLFRAGELGDEDWPLVKVAIDGKIVNINTDTDQPITFGQKFTDVWANPQLASR
ncbi:hypothetical protein NIES2100_42080 [Calothrix sp. NIES-2100]|uniref:hypothetical protein n=1 Tax=Calothrix sp. NIES-2100 TaxID=1954172 RepID=UPI000B61B55E|nr:hypothetical protein NIES2100_42080 [Calothrix sp. NIES-2100]